MNLKEEIGIIILDAFSQQDLDNCFDSVPLDLRENIYIVSNTKNKLPGSGYAFSKEVSFAAMRNRGLSYWRNLNKKYYFLMKSNYAITKNNFFEDVLNTASTFGTWFMTGPGSNTLKIDDEQKNLTLHLTPELNAGFVFLFSGLIKKYGYFDEQLYADNQLEVLDYIERMRRDGTYPPRHFNPCIPEGLFFSGSEPTKIPLLEPKSSEITFGYYQHLHQYIPGYNDPTGTSADQMFLAVENIQNNYAREI